MFTPLLNEMLFSLLGGIGLFMLGMNHMTEGVKLAAGNRLSLWLAAGTRTPVQAFLTGMLITTLVQSSGVCSVLLLGFVSAGMLRFDRALYALYGANIATTNTAWLVALAGFDFRFGHYALPMIGVGALFYLFRQEKRDGALGQALLGFGLFLLGLAFLTQAFSGIGKTLPGFTSDSWLTLLAFVLAGLVVTTLMQSSSASSAVTLSAVTGGTLGLEAAAAVLIGANIGSTTTALIASLRQNDTARQLARGNLYMNLGTALVALLLITPILALQSVGCSFYSEHCPATLLLASFNTFFNVLAVVLFWPWTERFCAWLTQETKQEPRQEADPAP